MAEEFKNVTKENLVYYDSKLKQHISNSIPDSLPASDVYDWAKQPTKPTYTYSEVGAEKSGSVASHNSSTTAHSDIRSLISTVEDSLVSSVSKKSQIQMGTPNSGLSFVPTLKIHRMTQTEYESAVANGTIEENSLYLTPDDPIDLSGYAKKTDITSHTGNTTVHVTADERANWDSAKAHANSAHAPSSAQANVIETVKVNGAALTPSSKAVDITVPTKVSALTNDSGYITSSGTAKTISDTLPVSKGGTGKTSAIDAANSFINALSTGSEIPKDADYIVTQYVGGGTTTTTYHRRPIRTLADYVKSKLATVAISGSYNDLNNKPTIPSVGNGTITITQNGNTKGTFTMNQSDNATIALTDTNTTYPAATTTVAGLMSANDKIKLDNIDAEANKIIVDSALSSTSVNPVQNKIVYSAIDNLKFDFAAIKYSIEQKTMVQLITWEAND